MTNNTGAAMKEAVEKIYRENETRTDKGLDEMVITQALDVATEPCTTRDDYFMVLSALNLLNAAIKDARWKHELSYGFIKGQAARLFDQWIAKPVEGIRAYYNEREGAVFFDVEGVIFSYHRIAINDRIRGFIRSSANKPIEWGGIRLQKIPVEVFDLASQNKWISS